MAAPNGNGSLVRLKKMIGKTFMYKGQNITITNYHVLPDEGKVQIDIKEGPYIKTPNIDKFLEFCLPVEQGDDATTAVSTEVIQQTDSLLATLQNTLLDNIAKVQKNEKYIKQATVINSSVNALIGMAKLQLQVKRFKKEEL